MIYRVMLPLIAVVFTVTTAHAQKVTLPDIDTSGSPNGIVSFPFGTPSLFTDLFSTYTKVMAPNGKPIHFLIQDEWPEDEIIKVRDVMEHMLADFPDSRYGNDKSPVSNAMSDTKSTMLLFNSPENSRAAQQGPLGNNTDLALQSMWTKETVVEGTDDYMDHITRDASYEEVLHLVQRRGIMNGLPKYQVEIEAAHVAAAIDSNSIEYFAQEFDVYYDLWAIQPKRWEGADARPGQFPEGTAHGGSNPANTRARLLEVDPTAYELVTSFFQPYLTYTPRLPADFDGTFSMEFDSSKNYTHKSQHLKNVTLTGDEDANLLGNYHENNLTGNAGDNTLTGSGGNDQLHGGDGNDTAVYAGGHAEYTITKNDGYATIEDERMNRDGTDHLTDIEFLQFSDKKVTL